MSPPFDWDLFHVLVGEIGKAFADIPKRIGGLEIKIGEGNTHEISKGLLARVRALTHGRAEKDLAALFASPAFPPWSVLAMDCLLKGDMNLSYDEIELIATTPEKFLPPKNNDVSGLVVALGLVLSMSGYGVPDGLQ
jgi:hypothetical protein